MSIKTRVVNIIGYRFNPQDLKEYMNEIKYEKFLDTLLDHQKFDTVLDDMCDEYLFVGTKIHNMEIMPLKKESILESNVKPDRIFENNIEILYVFEKFNLGYLINEYSIRSYMLLDQY